jgi:hypothetical protein
MCALVPTHCGTAYLTAVLLCCNLPGAFCPLRALLEFCGFVGLWRGLPADPPKTVNGGVFSSVGCGVFYAPLACANYRRTHKELHGPA